MAGQETCEGVESVRPSCDVNANEVEADESDGMGEGEVGKESLVCGKEEEVVRRGVVDDNRCVRGIGDPRKPSQKDVDEHELTHLPYRNWCAVCVRGKGKDLDHRKVVGDEREVSEYSFDYFFPGDELGYKLTILGGRERTTGAVFCVAVPSKGGSGKFAVDRALDFVEEVGDKVETIIVKTDQETSIKYFVKD